MTPMNLDLDGRALEGGWWGPRPEAAPTIVLLHEGLGSLSLWKAFPARLAEATGLGVFAWSRFGYGRSAPVQLPRPMDYMHAEATQVLPAVLDRIGFRRGILMGHSDGASIAAIHAGSFQDHRVRGLLLLSPHFFVEDVTVAHIAEAKRRYETGDLRARLARHHADVDNAFRGWNDAWLDPRFRAFDLTAELAHIRVPIRIVQGLADPYGTIAQAELAQRECYCPVDVVALPGVGHAPHAEAETAVLETAAEFTTRLFRLHEPEIT
jgi:pimeloyl-ACP methyl ester carboxylesterase